jgi:hypothetical protein
MTAPPAVGVGQTELDAALLLLSRMGITLADLLAGATPRPPAPTFAEYIPVVSAAVSDASRRAYGPYWTGSKTSGPGGASMSPRRPRSSSYASTSGRQWSCTATGVVAPARSRT